MNAAEEGAVDRRVLVVCYSRSGATERVARELALRLHADVEILQDRARRSGWIGSLTASRDAWRKRAADIMTTTRDPANYALTVIGTPVWAWQMTPAVRAYLMQSGARIRKVAFFVTSGDTAVSRILPSLEQLAGQTSVASAGFNARELADAAIYEQRLQQFVTTLSRSVPAK
jgi:flavodoxin